jgi:hypothetical protein
MKYIRGRYVYTSNGVGRIEDIILSSCMRTVPGTDICIDIYRSFQYRFSMCGRTHISDREMLIRQVTDVC